MGDILTYGNVGEPSQDEWHRDSLLQSYINEQDYETNRYVLHRVTYFDILSWVLWRFRAVSSQSLANAKDSGLIFSR